LLHLHSSPTRRSSDLLPRSSTASMPCPRPTSNDCRYARTNERQTNRAGLTAQATRDAAGQRPAHPLLGPALDFPCGRGDLGVLRSEEHTSELQSRENL